MVKLGSSSRGRGMGGAQELCNLDNEVVQYLTQHEEGFVRCLHHKHEEGEHEPKNLD